MGVDEIIANNIPQKTEIIKKEKISSLEEIINYARSLAQSSTSIDQLKEKIENFEYCELKKTANKTVFGEGTLNARILFIGEAPGATEDTEGRPFCGDSGKLLDLMLKSIGLARAENIYITNSIFWRPPGNRRPTPSEIAICRPFVERIISLINPSMIIMVGSTAVSSVLGITEPITMVRKQYYDYNNEYLQNKIKATAIFHPSYLLRQPSQKKHFWFDLLKIRRELAGT